MRPLIALVPLTLIVFALVSHRVQERVEQERVEQERVEQERLDRMELDFCVGLGGTITARDDGTWYCAGRLTIEVRDVR